MIGRYRSALKLATPLGAAPAKDVPLGATAEQQRLITVRGHHGTQPACAQAFLCTCAPEGASSLPLSD